MKQHKPECASNTMCAVYHNNGICDDPKQCDCDHTPLQVIKKYGEEIEKKDS